MTTQEKPTKPEPKMADPKTIFVEASPHGQTLYILRREGQIDKYFLASDGEFRAMQEIAKHQKNPPTLTRIPDQHIDQLSDILNHDYFLKPLPDDASDVAKAAHECLAAVVARAQKKSESEDAPTVP